MGGLFCPAVIKTANLYVSDEIIFPVFLVIYEQPDGVTQEIDPADLHAGNR